PGEPSKNSIVSRCAATATKDVSKMTRVYLLRLRHQLTSIRKRKLHPMMAEELLTVAFEGKDTLLPAERTGKLLNAVPSANVNEPERYIRDALTFWRSLEKFAEEIARERAGTLLDDHKRVKDASNDSGSYEVHPCLPVDLLGAYVLLPDEEAL
ncbi:MAG: hypothetical protein FWG71_09195, partial [Synergistaceae bacterium]|nr:hypothetical protein [Synergistaceae bacterium]